MIPSGREIDGTMVDYVWWRHTKPPANRTKSCLSMLLIKWMLTKLEYLFFDTHEGAQQVGI
jgi:hypothetical protein